MSSSNNGNNNKNLQEPEDSLVKVTRLIRHHANQRPTEADIDNVMARLADADLGDPAGQRSSSIIGINSQEDGDALVSEEDAALLDSAYRRYRQRRIDPDSAQIEAVMQRLHDSEIQFIENEMQHSVDVSNPSIWKSLFNFPLQVVRKAGSVIKTALSGRSKGLVPALALAVTAVAVVPLLIQNTDDVDTDAGIEQLAFVLPQSLLDNPLAIQNIDSDPGLVAAMAADNDVIDQVVSLGQRMTEIEILLGAENVQTAAPLIASRLNSLSERINDDAIAASLSNLSALVEQRGNDNAQVKSAVEQLKVQLSESPNPELTDALAWLVFGEAIEALSIAERLARSEDPLALLPSSALTESLKQFNAMNFVGSLPALSDSSAQVLQQLVQSGDSSLDTAQKRADVRSLLQQLRLSL